jgi:hypothetical protein
VKVGHRQTPYKQKAPPDLVGLFALAGIIRTYIQNVVDHTNAIDIFYMIECAPFEI